MAFGFHFLGVPFDGLAGALGEDSEQGHFGERSTGEKMSPQRDDLQNGLEVPCSFPSVLCPNFWVPPKLESERVAPRDATVIVFHSSQGSFPDASNYSLTSL